nr:MAG TPA: hypothetical protein [Caudoviricetes sp.]
MNTKSPRSCNSQSFSHRFLLPGYPRKIIQHRQLDYIIPGAS